VDIGAYEFQNPTSVISYAWLQEFGLPADGSEDYTDPDGGGMNNWQEWICGTDPTNASSVLKMLFATNGASGIRIIWQSVSNRSYVLERSNNLLAQPAFLALATNIAGQFGATTFIDANTTGNGTVFYRVGVQANP